MNHYFIPELSTQAGSCLTTENWEHVGIEMASYSLSALLMKPGIELLKIVPNLATYVGWHKSLVLNASMLLSDAQGTYSLRSSYDGSRHQFSAEELLALMIHLSPQFVILPKGLCRSSETDWTLLPETIMPFFPITECPHDVGTREYGIYVEYDGSAMHTVRQQLIEYPDRPKYILGDCSADDLVGLGACYFESNKPANDAYQGLVYHRNGIIRLQNDAEALQFEVIDSTCECPTCEQKLTRAYLHHLYEHTPLLCQRFLIQHNVFHVRHLRRA